MAFKFVAGQAVPAYQSTRPDMSIERFQPFIHKAFKVGEDYTRALQEAKSGANGLNLPAHKAKVTEMLLLMNRIAAILTELRSMR